MAKMIALKIDVTKIDKTKLFKGEKGTYLSMTVALNDETDSYGNNVSCWVEQTKEERDSKSQRTFLGNGKVVWSNDNSQHSNRNTSYDQDHNQMPPHQQYNGGLPVEENLPF